MTGGELPWHMLLDVEKELVHANSCLARWRTDGVLLALHL
jgi:hypothetical protein